MPSLYFEDFPKGFVREYGAHHVTKDSIIEFAREFDPQPFHLDEEAGKKSILGGLSGSGWQTASVAMRLIYETILHDAASLGSPGVEELRWLKPVRPGDILSLRAEVLDARVSRSRPGMGILTWRFGVRDQDGQEVMWQRSLMMLGTRDTPPLAPRTPPERPAPAALPDFAPDFLTIDDTNGVLTGWLDDLVVGFRIETGSYAFTRDNMLRFARAYDPQVFHVDEEAAKHSFFGGLAASGWHTASACMSRLVASRSAYAAEARRRNLPRTPAGPSPGFRDLKWLQPVYLGDVISYSTTPLEKRNISREGWGIAFHRNEGLNQNGDKVFEFTSSSLWPLRG
ncbi:MULTISPECIES: MaoC family dehydratase [unclassified Beijerinckia]|uniref:MaoC family dehydratase n=1 Tax=unclassified Beijerinckia TaxID=2638183 RepID=UPI0008968948|nr:MULTISPECIES: MaoC family dehydratase [unclassified Beijerinckia]MDH7799494.1 acyl dehydratase [Beijerinckia sp. GAS462]SED52417.1 Acyl dehydratase [Beijerinckia sp. 28-YEA-48]